MSSVAKNPNPFSEHVYIHRGQQILALDTKKRVPKPTKTLIESPSLVLSVYLDKKKTTFTNAEPKPNVWTFYLPSFAMSNLLSVFST